MAEVWDGHSHHRDTLTSATATSCSLTSPFHTCLAHAADKITGKENPTPVLPLLLPNPSEKAQGILNFIFPKLPYKLNLFPPKHIIMKTIVE